MNEEQIEQFLPYIYDKLNWLDREQLIKHFVSAEFNRYLSYYKNSKDINIEAQVHGRGETKRPKRNRKKFFNSRKNKRRNKRNKRKRKK